MLKQDFDDVKETHKLLGRQSEEQVFYV